MRKRIITRPPQSPPREQGWIDLESIASVDVTSENNAFPIESALLQQDKGGWRAAEPATLLSLGRFRFARPHTRRNDLT